jgi:hypothetical protein
MTPRKIIDYLHLSATNQQIIRLIWFPFTVTGSVINLVNASCTRGVSHHSSAKRSFCWSELERSAQRPEKESATKTQI